MALDIHQIDRHFDVLKDAGVPRPYRLWSLKDHTNFDPRQTVLRDAENQPAQDVCDGFDEDSWIVLAGSVGTGKPTFATAAFNDMVANRVKRSNNFPKRAAPVWITEARFMRMASVAGAAGYHGRAAYVGRLALAPVLVLDDLAGGRTELTKWGAGAVRDIIDERYANSRPTIFTTNLDAWELLERRYGDHIVSRMIQRAKWMTLLQGHDRRRLKAIS